MKTVQVHLIIWTSLMCLGELNFMLSDSLHFQRDTKIVLTQHPSTILLQEYNLITTFYDEHVIPHYLRASANFLQI